MSQHIDESVPLLYQYGEEWLPRRRRTKRRFAMSALRISKPKEVK